MTKAGIPLVALLMTVVPGGVSGQCGIDLIESGIRAYRDLELEAAQELMRNAIDLNRRAAASCATENARALTYIGASHWLRQLPDSAVRSFEQAVIRAPRFRPDGFEFPPDITEAFEQVRRSTPAVAVTLPDAVEIGPYADEAMDVRLAASTVHWVTVTLLSAGDPIRTLYRGPIATMTEGLVLEWNGRDSEGFPVTSGRYDLEVVSGDSELQPIRKVVVPLTVESDAELLEAPSETVEVRVPQRAVPSRDGVWKAAATAGVGLLGGALVIGVPPLITGFPETGARYVVGGSIAVAGIIGFVRWVRSGRAEPPPISSDELAPVPGPAERAPSVPPTLRIRVGFESRVELGGEGPLTDGDRDAPPLGR